MSQLRHWEQVGDNVAAVGEFLAWLELKYGVRLDWDYANPGTPLDVGLLIDEHFGVDRAQLDRERRELLNQISPEQP